MSWPGGLAENYCPSHSFCRADFCSGLSTPPNPPKAAAKGHPFIFSGIRLLLLPPLGGIICTWARTSAAFLTGVGSGIWTRAEAGYSCCYWPTSGWLGSGSKAHEFLRPDGSLSSRTDLSSAACCSTTRSDSCCTYCCFATFASFCCASCFPKSKLLP